jgi:putative ABC transport system ATP-binding protein
MLEIKNASKTFLRGTPNEHAALNAVSLSLDDGEFVTIIGSNGAGKTTLFNAVCGTSGWTGAGSCFRETIHYMPSTSGGNDGRLFQDPRRAPRRT